MQFHATPRYLMGFTSLTWNLPKMNAASLLAGGGWMRLVGGDWSPT